MILFLHYFSGEIHEVVGVFLRHAGCWNGGKDFCDDRAWKNDIEIYAWDGYYSKASSADEPGGSWQNITL